MTLYLIDGCGVLSEGAVGLPATVSVMPAARMATLDGRPLVLTGGSLRLPAGLAEGKHTLSVDGRATVFKVQSGKLCAEFDPKCLLPTLMRLTYLEKRVEALEKANKENEVNWLK